MEKEQSVYVFSKFFIADVYSKFCFHSLHKSCMGCPAYLRCKRETSCTSLHVYAVDLLFRSDTFTLYSNGPFYHPMLGKIHSVGLVWLVVAYFCNKLIFTSMVGLKPSSKVCVC